MGQTEKPLFDFARPTDAGEWVVINDGVMGGLSRSSMTVTGEGTALFAGTVSLENYGGFASTSTRPRPLDLEGYDGILVRVRGDGKQYEFRIRTGGRFDGIAYAYAFETRKDAWVTVRVPFAGCVPTFRGRTLTGVDPVSAELIQQVGFLISNKQEGAFRLEIDWISAYK
ncbi:CIA30 family protein [bacterium]|nr:CIA30 family protein [bacterium]